MAARELKPLVGPTMTFSSEDMRPLQTPQNDALVIQLKVAIAMVRRVLVDIGSFVDIITLECPKKLQYNKKDLKTVETLIVGATASGEPLENDYFTWLFYSATMNCKGLPIQFLRPAIMGTRVGLLQFGHDETESKSLLFTALFDSVMTRLSRIPFNLAVTMSFKPLPFGYDKAKLESFRFGCGDIFHSATVASSIWLR
ncbi:hypothetical protein Cgig2_007367 [Carnegiea gigantea]|uniref:Uncharacterized protein n=1 Tax=Carnegiea gigantea TaxID=171969 RepID=A0A9Q1KZR5_9CARY|nr:hypothetical protein Cgig2_007367 [Carnegiea gigantea]